MTTDIIEIENKDIVESKEKPNLLQIKSDNLLVDYKYARDNIIFSIDNLKSAIEECTNMAKYNPSPRLFESMSVLVKTFIDGNKELLNISGVNGMRDDNDNRDNSINNNIVFVGSPEDLITKIVI